MLLFQLYLNRSNSLKVTESELELLEMANLGYKHTGIPNVVIWIGMDPVRHALRIKVSNAPNKWSNDNFTIAIPDLTIVAGDPNKKLITKQTYEDIINWIKLNYEPIVQYEQGEITYTDDFLTQLVKI